MFCCRWYFSLHLPLWIIPFKEYTWESTSKIPILRNFLGCWLTGGGRFLQCFYNVSLKAHPSKTSFFRWPLWGLRNWSVPKSRMMPCIQTRAQAGLDFAQTCFLLLGATRILAVSWEIFTRVSFGAAACQRVWLPVGVLGWPLTSGLMPLILFQHGAYLVPKTLILKLGPHLSLSSTQEQDSHKVRCSLPGTYFIWNVGAYTFFSWNIAAAFCFRLSCWALVSEVCLYSIRWIWKHSQYSNDLRQPGYYYIK